MRQPTPPGTPLQAVLAVRRRCRGGVTLLELTMAIVILGLLGGLVLARLSITSLDGEKNACYIQKENLEVQAELWFRNKGTWPAANLSDVGADVNYFPDGLPICPVDGTAYVLDGATHRVTGHVH